MKEGPGTAVKEEAALTPQEMEYARRFAQGLVERRLGAPALFLLEGMRPMNFVFSQALAFFSPVIKIVHDKSKIDVIQEMLEKREAIPYILTVIHQLEEARRG